MVPPKEWEVVVLASADRDIDEIVAYLAVNESLEFGEKTLDRIEEAVKDLSAFPDRGRIPPELRKQTQAYREIQVWPYRVVYEVDRALERVAIHLVIDGRRNTAKIMEERLLRPPVCPE